ncbi:MAG: XkdF-like putative serine protease domain-containing protein [Solirubrobacteraceae bacterium]|jgi:hypothetical protein
MCLLCGQAAHTDPHGRLLAITLGDFEAACAQAGVSTEQGARNLAKSVDALALVRKGPPPMQAEYAACRVVKTVAEQRYSLGLAYPAMRLDRSVASDGHIDFVSAGALEQTAWNWMSKEREIGLFHTKGTEGHATVVESYLWPADEPWVIKGADGTVQRICKGDWLLGTVWDEHGWALVKAGLVNGWSPEGGARRSRPSASRLAELRS